MNRTIVLLAAFSLSLCLPAETLRLMSYNIRHGEGMDGRLDLARVARVITAERPDIIGLQEIDSGTGRVGGLCVPDELARLTGLQATYCKSIDFDGGAYGNLILSREKPMSVRRYALPGDEPRSLVVCEFSNCFFGTTHLCVANPTNRTAAVKILGEVVAGLSVRKPVFLSGDWNSLPESETLTQIRGFMTVLSGSSGATYHGDLTCAPAEMSSARDHCIDYIAVDRGHADRFAVRSARIVPERTASDHAPIFVEVAASADWIAGPYEPPSESEFEKFFEDAPASELRRTFTLDHGAVRRATWRIASPGLCDAFVNGVRVTSTALTPWTEFDARILSVPYDVTSLLQPGENVLELRLGNGWYNALPMKMWGRHNLRENLPQGTPCVQAELTVETAGLPDVVVPTDAAWQAAEGPVLRNSLYLGEKYDARRTWRNLRPARVVAGPKGAVLPAENAPKTIVYERWKARAVHEPKPGVFVVDFGVNFAGNVRSLFRGVGEGETVAIKYGEILNPDGTVNGLTTVAGQLKKPENKPPGGIAYQRDSFIGNGAPANVFEPRFTYHTFRYAEVSGLKSRPVPEDFEALAYSADVHDCAGFVCSNDKLNRVREICRRTFRANLQQDVQSDCPARERFGYGGDLAATAESFMLNYDMRGLYRKILRDRMDSALRNNDEFPAISPLATRAWLEHPRLGWAVDVPIVVDLLVRYCGDREVVGETYPSLVRFLGACARHFKLTEIRECIGDHEALEKADACLTATCHYHQFLLLTAKFARMLGLETEAKTYEEQAREVESLFSCAADGLSFRGSPTRGVQGELAFALYHGMLSKDDAKHAYGLLKRGIAGKGNALTTGIFATPYMLDILSGNGDADLAGRLALREGFPGWFHMLDRGATTVWETWAESDDVYSHCHPMFGTIAGWMMRAVLGICVTTDAVGCDKVRICPHPVPGVTWASGWLDTPKGRISVSWRSTDGGLEVEKRVPQGILEVN